MTPQEITLFFAYHLLLWSAKAQKKAAYMRAWIAENPDKQKQIRKTGYAKNRVQIRAEQKDYNSRHKGEQRRRSQKHYVANRQKAIDRATEYNRTPQGKKNRRDWDRKKTATDISYKLGKNIRSRIWWALQAKASKSARTEELLGCSISHLKEWLQFWMKPGMTWENHGDWHIDHKKPCASFDLTKPEEQRKCFHYTNLEPLWAFDNLSKGAK